MVPTPVFSSFQTSYTATVPQGVASIDIVPTAYDPKHRAVTINGTPVVSGRVFAAALRPGENRFDLVVTAERGTGRTYTLVVTKEAAGSE